MDDPVAAYYDAILEDEDRFDKPWVYANASPAAWIRANAQQFIRTVDEISNERFPVGDLDARLDAFPFSRTYVYFLFSDDLIGYVGQSGDISFRMSRHRERWIDITHLTLMAVPRFFVDRIEAYYIHKLRPDGNVKYPGLTAPFDKP